MFPDFRSTAQPSLGSGPVNPVPCSPAPDDVPNLARVPDHLFERGALCGGRWKSLKAQTPNGTMLGGWGGGVLSNWQCPLFRPRTARDKEIGPEQLHFSTEAEPLLCSPSLGKWPLQNVVSNCRPQTGASP